MNSFSILFLAVVYSKSWHCVSEALCSKKASNLQAFALAGGAYISGAVMIISSGKAFELRFRCQAAAIFHVDKRLAMCHVSQNAKSYILYNNTGLY